MTNIFFQFKNATFSPEELIRMGEAFDLVKRAMPETDQYDIARSLLVASQQGVRSTGELAAGAMDLLTPVSDNDNTLLT